MDQKDPFDKTVRSALIKMEWHICAAPGRNDVPSLKEALRRHSEHYRAVLRSTNELYEQGGDALSCGLAAFDLESSNIQAGFAYSERHSGDSHEAAALCSAYPIAGFYLLNLRLTAEQRLRWFKAGYAAARRLKGRRAQEMHLGNMGLAYTNLGQTEKALKCQKKFLRISRTIHDDQNQANALGLLGLAYLDLDETDKAENLFEEELLLARQMKDRRTEGIALNHRGLIYALLDDHHRAIESWKQDLKLSREIGDRNNEGTALGNLGISYEKLGKKNRALALYRQQLAIAREIGDKSGEARSLWNTSLLFAALNHYNEAVSAAEEVLKIYEEIDVSKAEIRNHIAHWRKGSSPRKVTLWNGFF